MNLPIGLAKESGKRLHDFKVGLKIKGLLQQKFIGFMVITIEGTQGVEEGLLFLKKDQAVGAIYEFSKTGKTVFGDTALPLFFNAAAAEHGIADVYALSPQQFDLVIAFNEKILFHKPLSAKEASSRQAKAFNSGLTKKFLVGEKEESRFDVLKRFGLGRI